jgi:uncharacterized protein
MRVLVTGGTGFVGRPLVIALRSRGDEAVVVSRRPRPGEVGWDAIEREMERADAVVHLAGEPIADGRWTKQRLQRIRASRVQPTRAIARAIERSTHKPRVLVSASAVGIYGMRDDDRELDESAPPADDVLASIVVEWERAADVAKEAGVRVVHPRIGIVLGRDGGALARIAAPFRWFVGGPLGNGRQWISWIHVADAVRALIFAIDCDGTSSSSTTPPWADVPSATPELGHTSTTALAGPVNVVAREPVTMQTFAQSIARALHRPAALRVPPLALELALGKGLAQALLTGQRAVPRKLNAAGFAFRFPGIQEACADLL